MMCWWFCLRFFALVGSRDVWLCNSHVVVASFLERYHAGVRGRRPGYSRYLWLWCGVVVRSRAACGEHVRRAYPSVCADRVASGRPYRRCSRWSVPHRVVVRGVLAGEHAARDVTRGRGRRGGGAARRGGDAGVRRRQVPRVPAAGVAGGRVRARPLPRAARRHAAASARPRLSGGRVRGRTAPGGALQSAAARARVRDAGGRRRAAPRHRVLRRGPRGRRAAARDQPRRRAAAAAPRHRRAAQPARQLQPHVRREEQTRRRAAVLGRRAHEQEAARAVQARALQLRRADAHVGQAAQRALLRRPEHAGERVRLQPRGGVDERRRRQPAPSAPGRGRLHETQPRPRHLGRVRGDSRRADAQHGLVAPRGVPEGGQQVPRAEVHLDGGARAGTERGYGRGGAQRPVRDRERDPRGGVLREHVRLRVLVGGPQAAPQLRAPSLRASVLLQSNRLR